MKKKILLVVVNNYFDDLKKKLLNYKIFFVKKKNKLNLKIIKKINPDYIFVPHWHWKIDDKITQNYNCIGFHCAPLPYGRGGSPIQNLIIRGFKKTQVCSFKINNKFDAGDIYLKNSMSLSGNGNELFIKLYKIIKKQIFSLLKKMPNPKKQVGKAVFFRRRKPEESRLNFDQKITKIYDFIRMLDVNFKNFPKAFFLGGKYKIELTEPQLKKKKKVLIGKFRLLKHE